jgi:hypothetical protein
MTPIPVLLIFDIGKTNKKLFLFNEAYQVVHEVSTTIDEIKDEDGFDCEDIVALSNWVKSSIKGIQENPSFEIKYMHCAAYGASFVFIDEQRQVLPPLYNYLKPFKESTKQAFELSYGAMDAMSLATASPYLGNLNSGLQLYRIKKEQPVLYNQIKWALHLPQYIHYLIKGALSADITSIGCHTMLWNFSENKYHDWVLKEGLDKLLPPTSSKVGLHDSSSALIPYLNTFTEPFVLISTGTWCISLNPFNDTTLTIDELKQDVLCYLSYTGKPIKAARLFSGKAHEQGVLLLDTHFNKAPDYFTSIHYDAAIIIKDATENFDLAQYPNYETAYHHLVAQLVRKQIISTNLIIAKTKVKRIFVDGGFSKNEIFMNLLAMAYPQYEVFAAAIPQASALGAALAVHEDWNSKTIPNNLISLQYYASKNKTI